MAIQAIHTAAGCSLHQVSRDEIGEFIVSTPETRGICNNPFIFGVDYTHDLRVACSKAFVALQSAGIWKFNDAHTVVLSILRGGLNFGLREALYESVGCRLHNSAFISAQRARRSDSPQDWVITENAYQKLALRGSSDIVFGDVVATGTSLEHALGSVVAAAVKQHASISNILFLTIGSARSSEILRKIARLCRERFPDFGSAVVVYFEGIFQTATLKTAVTVKVDGTDLLRTGSLLAPEFVESQYESPSFPIERCTIYDAGSRAFDVADYFSDIRGYWEKNLELASQGMTYQRLLAERMPELVAKRFANVDLAALATAQLQRIPSALSTVEPHSG